jgi:hypothetical protein
MREFWAMKKLQTPAWGHTACSWQAKRTDFQFTVQTVTNLEIITDKEKIQEEEET